MLPNVPQKDVKFLKGKIIDFLMSVNDSMVKNARGNNKRSRLLYQKTELINRAITIISGSEDFKGIKRAFGIAVGVLLQKKVKIGYTTSEATQLAKLINTAPALREACFGHEKISYRELRKFAKLQLENKDDLQTIKVPDNEHAELEKYFSSLNKDGTLANRDLYSSLLEECAIQNKNEEKSTSTHKISAALQDSKQPEPPPLESLPQSDLMLKAPLESVLPSPSPPAVTKEHKAEPPEEVVKIKEEHVNLVQQTISKEKIADTKVQPEKKSEKIEKVLYLSLDFDSCFAWNVTRPDWWGDPSIDNSPASQEKRMQWIKDNQRKLIDDILEGNKELFLIVADRIVSGNYTKLCINVGTNRQDPYRDYWNMILHASPSFVPVLEAAKVPFANAIKAELNEKKSEQVVTLEYDRRLMVSTTMSTRQPGEESTSAQGASRSDMGAAAIENLMAKSSEEIVATAREGIMSLFDRSKITLLYQQMHRAKTLNPGMVDFHFLDDSFETILLPLQHFFQNNPDLVPSGLTLHLHHYAKLGNDTQAKIHPHTRLKPIPGKGNPDHQYKETILLSSAISLDGHSQHIKNVLAYMTNNINAKTVAEGLSVLKPFVDAFAKFGTAITVNGLHHQNDGYFDANTFKNARKYTALLSRKEHKGEASLSASRTQLWVSADQVQHELIRPQPIAQQNQQVPKNPQDKEDDPGQPGVPNQQVESDQQDEPGRKISGSGRQP